MSEPLQLNLSVLDELIEQLAQQIADHLQQREADRCAGAAASPWLTFSQACEYLGLSRNALYKLTAARAIPCRKKQDGQGLRFQRAELDQWMQEQYPRLDRLG